MHGSGLDDLNVQMLERYVGKYLGKAEVEHKVQGATIEASRIDVRYLEHV